MSVLLSVLVLLHSAPALAEGCRFLDGKDQFEGTPLQQAQCLLRTIRRGGVVEAARAKLPLFLELNVGKPVSLRKAELLAYVKRAGIADRDLGGSPNEPLVKTSRGTPANYFVIHDTSDDLPSEDFPSNINDASSPINRVHKRDISMAHVFVSRDGKSASGNLYSEALGATKREQGVDAEGLFLHHELVQPRIKGGFRYHAVAPVPGFTPAQYRRLALLYVVASVRRGTWLIPAYHCAVDEGIPDGHDDPQNFELAHWSSVVAKLVQEISGPKK